VTSTTFDPLARESVIVTDVEKVRVGVVAKKGNNHDTCSDAFVSQE
jgi:hypothetical protein